MYFGFRTADPIVDPFAKCRETSVGRNEKLKILKKKNIRKKMNHKNKNLFQQDFCQVQKEQEERMKE